MSLLTPRLTAVEADRKEIVIMSHIAHRLAAALLGVLILGALALPAATASAAEPQPATSHTVAEACTSPDNPVWGDGICIP
jgi:hypothetical protein